jgi:L-ribulokinase
MTFLKAETYKPNPEAQTLYNELFAEYKKMHDAFGGEGSADLGSLMKRLLEIKETAKRA